MTPARREELILAEQLLKQGEYGEALALTVAVATRPRLPAEEQLACLLLQARLRVKLGEYKDALGLIEQALPAASGRQDPLLAVDLLCVRAEASWRTGALEAGQEALAEGQALLASARRTLRAQAEGEIKRREGDLCHHQGIILWYRGELDEALACHLRCQTVREQLGDKSGLADTLNNIGLVLWSRGDTDEAVDYYQRSLHISEELGRKRQIAILLSNLGNLHARRGDLDQALACQKQSVTIKEELGLEHDLPKSLINLGVVYQLRGELDRAREHYQRSLVASEGLGVKPDIALSLNNLGNIDELRGDLGRALAYFETSLAIYRELGIKPEIALLLTNIGEIHRKKGDLERATVCHEQGLATYEEMGNDPLTAVALLELVWIALERGDATLAQQHLQKLQRINQQADNRSINQRYLMAQALALKASKRTRDKLHAQGLLEQIVEEEIADHSLTVTAMIHLCDLLLFELKMTGEDGLLAQITDLTYQLLKIAKEQSSHSLLAETYLLQSKLALIELDMGRARKLLTEAHAIAEEKGLTMLARAVSEEHDRLQSQVQMWELIAQQKPTQQELIDLTQLDGLLEQMVQRTVAVLAAEQERVPRVQAAPRPFVQGTLQGRYRLDAEIGRGGMGAVYRGHDTVLQRDVAVKVLSEAGLGTEGRARLLREAQSAAQLNHPNIVSIYDAGEVSLPELGETAPFIVMELVKGEALGAVTPRALAEIVAIARQVSAALDHAHAHGIIHRDLKPENVMIASDGTAKLLDFGLARTAASRLTAEGAILGTVYYMAPEQALGQQIDGRTDLYALGVLLYELTTGRLPFEAEDPVAVISQHLHVPPRSPDEHCPEIPQAFAALIVRLLSKRPDDRPSSAAEVEEALAQLLADDG